MTRKKSSKKKKKGGKSSFHNAVLNIFSANPVKSFNFRQVAAQLGISDKASKEIIKTILSELKTSSYIIEDRRGKYKLHPREVEKFNKTLISGKVDMKSTGKAYIITDEFSEDIYIAPNNTHHALNGDIVKVRLFPKRPGKKTEGRVVEIIKRAKKQFVGTIEANKKFAFLIPDNQKVPVDIYIPLTELKNAKNGNKAIAVITDWPEQSNMPFGKIIEVLGEPGDNDVEMNSILAEYEFPLSFPGNVEREADKIKVVIPETEISGRKDYRNIFTCTVDPADAKDFDDALSLQKTSEGKWEVGIHIADVSHYVKPGSLIDQEAYKRATSIYLVDRVIPMLPEILSNKVCSLRPNEDKLCFSAVFEMDEEANVTKEWMGKTIINSDRRYNYDEIQNIIEGNEGDYKEEILILHNLASKLREKRFSNGSINFHSSEVKFDLDEEGRPIGAHVKEQKDSNRLIEDFMLLANRRVAQKIGKKQGRAIPKTFVYRVHDVPNPEKMNNFIEFVGRLGYKLRSQGRKSLANSLNSLFSEIEGKGEQNLIETIAVRTMAKAMYSTENIGHYGLAFPYYTHFTSPIRRYPDLMVHRLLFGYLNSKSSASPTEYEEKCIHCSEMEKKAEEAERASIKYKQAEYLLDKVGKSFYGNISGVSKWGIFVELQESKCEGMISLHELADDFYYLDEDNYKVIGKNYGKEFKIGDKLLVKVKKIDLSRKRIDFAISE